MSDHPTLADFIEGHFKPSHQGLQESVARLENQIAQLQFTVNIISQKADKIMATIDDDLADEAFLAAAVKQLIQLAGNAVAEIGTLKANTTDTDTQTKLDSLHAALQSDLADITAAVTADGAPMDLPPAAPIVDTGQATGQTPSGT